MKFFVNFFVKPTVFATIKNFIIDLIWSNTFKCPGVDRGSSSSIYIYIYIEITSIPAHWFTNCKSYTVPHNIGMAHHFGQVDRAPCFDALALLRH